MRERLRIGVVGCGIAGTSFALLAKRNGHHVALFERTGHVGPIGAGVLLQPSGQRVLAAMGLLEAVTAHAEVVREIHALTHRGHELIRLRYDEHDPGVFAYGLHRGDLFSVLHQSLMDAGVELRLACEMNGCVPSGSELRLEDTRGTSHGPFDLVVAADGARSRLREICGIPHRCREYEHGALWAVGRSNEVRGKLFQVTRGTGRLAGMLPMGEGRCSFFWGIRRDEYERLRERKDWKPWRDEVASLMPLAAPMLEQIDSAELVFTTFWHTRMPRWDLDAMVFIGDAAHATSPHLGQGVNLALIDAATLASAIETAPTLTAAVTAYGERRSRQLRFYSRATGLLTPFFQSDGWIRGLGRDICLPRISRIAPFRRLMLATLRGEVFGDPAPIMPIERDAK